MLPSGNLFHAFARQSVIADGSETNQLPMDTYSETNKVLTDINPETNKVLTRIYLETNKILTRIYPAITSNEGILT